MKLPTASATRDRCLGCFRPRSDCYCEAIPTIDNQTPILIVQHRRERFHPFNTARMVHRALRRSTLLVDHTPAIAARLSVQPGAAVLYPGPGAKLLAEIPAHRRPQQLIIIDGTWHQAKTLVRDVPALGALPQFSLAPAEPSRFRIRREPDALFLSTVEATVAALRILEPATHGLDDLLATFHALIDRQLAHPKSVQGWRRNMARVRGGRNIPAALLGVLDRVVVAYGEVVTGGDGHGQADPYPAFWAAQRLGTNECFAQAIAPRTSVPASLFHHWHLSMAHFDEALSLAEVRSKWNDFLRPDDVVAVYSHGTARLLAQLGSQVPQVVELKAIEFNPGCRYRTLDELIAAEGLLIEPNPIPGRAGARVANAAALVRHLRKLREFARG